MAHVSIQERISPDVVDELREIVNHNHGGSQPASFPWLTTVSSLALGAFLLTKRNRKMLLFTLVPPALRLLKSWRS